MHDSINGSFYVGKKNVGSFVLKPHESIRVINMNDNERQRLHNYETVHEVFKNVVVGVSMFIGIYAGGLGLLYLWNKYPWQGTVLIISLALGWWFYCYIMMRRLKKCS